MKRLLNLGLLSALASLLGTTHLYADNQNETAGEKIRIISYNILNGFNGARQTARMEEMAKWLRKQDPEVIAFQELCGMNEQSLKKFAKLYGHSYVAVQKSGGYPVAWTSKQPIKSITKHTKGMVHGFFHIQTYGLDFINVHLIPTRCDARLKEARIVTDYIEESKLDQVLLMGDLNSVSPFDAEETEQHKGVIESCKAYYAKYKNDTIMRGNHFDYSVQAHFLAEGLEDLVRLHVPADERMTYPAMPEKGSRSNYLSDSGMRIDYIYASRPLMDQCSKAYVWNKKETWSLSDHFPIGIDFCLKK